ncbi:MAG: dienelactone hydrolase family protein [Akkermansiaceae bacterium]|nr:dienelactone hydrolase family protein [Akkermansiaceae bacterium]
MKPLLIAFFLGSLVSFRAVAADKEIEEDYAKRVERAKLEEKPENHRNLASWCRRNYPEKQAFHQNAYHEHVFAQAEAKLPAQPGASVYLDLVKQAQKLELPDKEDEYHLKWGGLQYNEFSAKLKPGNAKMMGQLLTWVDRNNLRNLDAAQELAKQLLDIEESEVARKVLGHVEIDGKWMTVAEAIAGIKLGDPVARVELHRKLAKARKGVPVEYPANPMKGLEQVGTRYMAATRASGGQAKYLLFENGYSRSKPCPLIIGLHGGGSGGYEKALEGARSQCGFWSRDGLKGGYVVLAPIARKHVTNSWGTGSNFNDLIDAIEETTRRFNIDRTRIYVTGQSMGGGGTSQYYAAISEFAAAYCARAGYYWIPQYAKPLAGKPIMVIHGDQDEAFRNATRDTFLEYVKNHDGQLEFIRYEDEGHNMVSRLVNPHMMPFFEKHRNEIEPDFELIRAAGLLRFK